MGRIYLRVEAEQSWIY